MVPSTSLTSIWWGTLPGKGRKLFNSQKFTARHYWKPWCICAVCMQLLLVFFINNEKSVIGHRVLKIFYQESEFSKYIHALPSKTLICTLRDYVVLQIPVKISSKLNDYLTLCIYNLLYTIHIFWCIDKIY